MKTTKRTLKELVLNKDLTVNEQFKNVIVKAEKGIYSYFDFNKEKITEIVSKDIKDITLNDGFYLLQALFPEYLICSGLFDSFLMFEIKNNVRIDPPKYFYGDFTSYLNNDKKLKYNFLPLEIKDLLDKNDIKYHDSWNKVLF